ncbi:MAG: hypothetical protein ACK5I7_05320 [Anaerotignum sp.]
MNKKNKFYTFCCSLVPGAGEMYMGLYKQGISLMVAFWLLIAVSSSIMGLEIFFAMVPVVWFYSFFHTHNLHNMPTEEFLRVKDKYLIYNDFNINEAEEIFGKNRKVFSVLLILVGVSMMLQMCMNILEPYLHGRLWDFFWILNHNAGTFVVGMVAVWAGIHFLRGSKDMEVA